MRDLEVGTELGSLPRGPYLCNLEWLNINTPNWKARSEALRDAVHLRNLFIHSSKHLGLHWNDKALWQLVPASCAVVFN